MPIWMPVLLAEDEQNDVFLMERAFRVANIPNPLVAVGNGKEAVDYLQKQGPGPEQPCVMLLDLKMPIMNGFEVLEWVGRSPYRDSLPVLVLSSSEGENDMRQAFELGAWGYLLKPARFDGLLLMVKELEQEWLQISEPRQREGLRSR